MRIKTTQEKAHGKRTLSFLPDGMYQIKTASIKKLIDQTIQYKMKENEREMNLVTCLDEGEGVGKNCTQTNSTRTSESTKNTPAMTDQSIDRSIDR